MVFLPRKHLAPIVFSLILIFSLSAHAQDPIADAIGTHEYRLSSVEIEKAELGKPMLVSFESLRGGLWTVELKALQVRGDYFTLAVQDAGGYRVVEAPPSRAVTGRILGEPDSWVRGTFFEDGSLKL
ncbi:MAG: hypothetical protein L3J79_12780, partial [Candidatus Marinimicrobia bacterium]|nr:hypothetical protein [Candidatus Neomarinimicrobiota bacterium]